MKSIRSISRHAILAGLCLATVAGAASAKTLTQTEALALQQRYVDAYIKRDVPALEALLDDRLVFVHGGGTSATKAETLDGLKAPPRPGGPAMTGITLAPDNKVFLSDGEALITGTNNLMMSGGGAAAGPGGQSRPEFCSYLWTETKTGWKLLLIHTTPTRAPGPPAGGAPRT